MTTLPPAPEAPLQLILCGCSKSVCEASRCKCKNSYLYSTDLRCCGAEEDPCKIIPASNMLMTFERQFSCGVRHFFKYINKKALQSDLDV